MGSLAEVKGSARRRAPLEMILRWRGQPSSMAPAPPPYRVPSTKSFDGDMAASIWGTYSGGCYLQVGIALHAVAMGCTHLQVCVHAQHVISLRLLEAPHDRATEAALRRADDNAHVEALLLQRLDDLHGAVA